MMKTQSAHPYSVFVLAMIATSMRYYLNVVDKKRSGAGGLPCPLRAPSGWRALSVPHRPAQMPPIRRDCSLTIPPVTSVGALDSLLCTHAIYPFVMSTMHSALANRDWCFWRLFTASIAFFVKYNVPTHVSPHHHFFRLTFLSNPSFQFRI